MSALAVDHVERNGVPQPVTPFDPAGVAPPQGRSLLRWSLVSLDALALLIAWAAAAFGIGSVATAERSVAQSFALMAVAVVGGLIAAAQQDLYLSRVSSVRTAEIAGLFRAVALSVGGVALAGVVFNIDIHTAAIVVGALLSLVLLLAVRSGFRVWLAGRRRGGAYVRDVVVIGTNDEAADLIEIIEQHPEFGLQVAAVVGDRNDAHLNGLAAKWAGEADQAADTLRRLKASGAIVTVSSMSSAALNLCVRDLLREGAHVQVTSALRGIAHRRLRAQPIAHEPLFYLEPATLSAWQLFVKRAIDIAVSGTMLLIISPVLVVCGLIVKLQDRGPAFFRQERVGRNGERFHIVKIRTMVVDAEQRLDEVRASRNERSGPLFKDGNDPRFTRFGHFLDATSLNELPQLWNVLRGQMSLVGPRPALPREIASFDDALHARHQVRPGITGLWQVEARDNPAFSAYRRYDLFYVENWSVTFDLVIMLATAEAVLARALRLSPGRWSRGVEQAVDPC